MLTKEDREKVVEEIKLAVQAHNGTIARDTLEAYAQKLNQFIEENSDSLLVDDLKPSNPQLTTHLDAVTEHITTFSQIVEALIEDSAKVDVPTERILQNKKILEDLSNSFNQIRNRVVEDKAAAENIAKIKLQIEDEQKKLDNQEADARKNEVIFKDLQLNLARIQTQVAEREAEHKKLENSISL